MELKLLLFAATLTIFLCSFESTDSYMVNGNRYRQREIIDENYILEWEYEPLRGTISFNVSVRTEGYVGFGLTKGSGMTDADIIIAGVNQDGTSYFKDMHTKGSRTLVEDNQEDWTLLEASEEDGVTSLRFSRPINTCDEDDIEITRDRIAIIWAYGETDNLEYHYNNRGVMDAYLLDPNLAPALEPDASGERGLIEGDDMIVYRLRKRQRLEAKPTSYIISIHKGLRLTRRHHAIGFRTYLGNEASRRHAHHLIVYRCKAPAGVDPRAVFEPFVNYPGEENYLNENRRIPANFCEGQPCYVWGIGGKPFFTSQDVGLPIGETPDEYFLLEVHYDNSAMRQPTDLEVGVDIYITPKLRRNTGHVLAIGFNIPGTMVVYPPASINASVIGHCDPQCSQQMFPQGGIKASSVMLHSHQSARKVSLRHFRNGKELPPVLSDDNYNPRFQQHRNLEEDVTFLPGDHFIMQCELDNSLANGTTVGGFGTPMEMCVALLTIDQVLTRDRCYSEYPAYRVLSRLGVDNVTWDLVNQDRVVTSPSSLRGLTLGQVSDRYVRWTTQKRNELENDIIYAAHAMACPNVEVPSAEEILRNASISTANTNSVKESQSLLATLALLGTFFSNTGRTDSSLQGQVQRAAEQLVRLGVRGIQQSNDSGSVIMRAGTGSVDFETRVPAMGLYGRGVPATAKFPAGAPRYRGNEDGSRQCTINGAINENEGNKETVSSDHDVPELPFWNVNANDFQLKPEFNNYQNLQILNFGF